MYLPMKLDTHEPTLLKIATLFAQLLPYAVSTCLVAIPMDHVLNTINDCSIRVFWH